MNIEIGKAFAIIVCVFMVTIVSGMVEETVAGNMILFEDDFNDGNADGWIGYAPNDLNVVDGAYCIAHGGVSFDDQTHTGNMSWTDYVFEADVIHLAGW